MITLSNIHQFTDEQIFDEVERPLKLQGVQSKIIGTSECLYSKDDGSKCAVGLLMDKYDESFEDNTLHRILKEFWPNALPKEPVLRILQNIHDNYSQKSGNMYLELLEPHYSTSYQNH